MDMNHAEPPIESAPEAWPDFRAALAHPVTLLVFRIIVGGLLLLAASQKIRAPKAFALSIDGFGIVPEGWIVTLAFFFVWQEIAAGTCLVLGIWSRAAAVISTGLLTIFLGALGWAVLKGLPIDCGCFGDLFGGKVGIMSLVRNFVLISMAVWVVVKGGGTIALERLWAKTSTTTNE